MSWELPPSEWDGVNYPIIRRTIRATIRRALYSLDDLGIWSQTEKDVSLTPWGDLFVCAWLNEELGPSDDDR